jgi:hypothetical protein
MKAESKQNEESVKNELDTIKELIEVKVNVEDFEEHKKTLKEFVESVSGDVSSFNKLLHFFEEKLAFNTKYIEYLKKKENEPKFSMKFKDDSNDRSELLHIIEKNRVELNVIISINNK